MLAPKALFDIAEPLSNICGFGSRRDSVNILLRVAHLAEQGETPTSIMRRLNPPAIIDQPHESETP